MKKYRKTMIAVLSAVIVSSAMAGAWAYFVRNHHMEVNANTATIDFTVQKDATVKDYTKHMLPGSQQEVKLSVQNTGTIEAKLFTEIEIKSKKKLSDNPEWYVTAFDQNHKEITATRSNGHTTGNFTADQEETFDELKGLKMISFTSSDQGSTVKYVMDCGKVAANGTQSIEYKFGLKGDADNRFQGDHLQVKTDVYAVQNEFVGNVNWATIRGDASLISSETSSAGA